MTFNPKKYNSKTFLKNKGKSLETHLAKKANEGIARLNTITDKVEGIAASKSFNFEPLLKRFWANCDSVSSLEKAFDSRRDRKYILMGLNTPLKGKTILKDYNQFGNLLKLYPFEESELILKRVVNTYLSFSNQINRNLSSKKTFQNYFKKAFATNDFALKKTRKLFDSRKYLIESNGVELFVRDKFKNDFDIEESLRASAFITGKSEFKSEIGYQYLLQCYKKVHLKRFLDSYEAILASNGESKKIIPLLVLIADESKNQSIQNEAKDVAIKYIGDPANKLSWSCPEDFTRTEEEILDKARKTLNSWILESFIEVFFEKLIDDPARKKYWLSKTDYIESVKVYGSISSKNVLKRDPRIGDYVNDRFQTLRSRDTNCGIVMQVEDFELVEFTDSGAMYCYLRRNERIPLYVDRLSELKDLPKKYAARVTASGNNYQYKVEEYDGYYLKKVYYLNEEGKINHSGDSWQKKIDVWLEKYVD